MDHHVQCMQTWTQILDPPFGQIQIDRFFERSVVSCNTAISSTGTDVMPKVKLWRPSVHLTFFSGLSKGPIFFELPKIGSESGHLFFTFPPPERKT